MTAKKKDQAEAGSAAPESGDTKRKPWIKKSPVEIILEQVTKQQEKVAEMRRELAKEEGELKKMQKAVEIFQAS